MTMMDNSSSTLEVGEMSIIKCLSRMTSQITGGLSVSALNGNLIALVVYHLKGLQKQTRDSQKTLNTSSHQLRIVSYSSHLLSLTEDNKLQIKAMTSIHIRIGSLALCFASLSFKTPLTTEFTSIQRKTVLWRKLCTSQLQRFSMRFPSDLR